MQLYATTVRKFTTADKSPPILSEKLSQGPSVYIHVCEIRFILDFVQFHSVSVGLTFKLSIFFIVIFHKQFRSKLFALFVSLHPYSLGENNCRCKKYKLTSSEMHFRVYMQQYGEIKQCNDRQKSSSLLRECHEKKTESLATMNSHNNS